MATLKAEVEKYAQGYVDAAADSAESAKASAEAASESVAKAAASEANAKDSENAAAGSATKADTRATDAENARDNAAESAEAAAGSADAAATSEANAADSAQAAATSETNAEASRADAAHSAALANNRATQTKTALDAANTAAANAKASENAAAESASAAATSKTKSEEYLNGTKEYFELVRTITLGAQGFFATGDDLTAAVPVGEDGWWAVVGTTDSIWVWDSDTSSWKNTMLKVDLTDYPTRTEVASTYAKLSGKNTYNGEQLFQNGASCPTAKDNTDGVGCAYKASRGAVNQEVVGELIMPNVAAEETNAGITNEANRIKIETITETAEGRPTLETEGYFEKGNGWVGKVNGLDVANMTPASAEAAGAAGFVPAPEAGKQAAFLRGDGTWAAVEIPTNVDVALKLANNGKASEPMTFAYAGQAGQPPWVWGGPTDYAGMNYVYNPANFNVNAAKFLGRSGDTNYPMVFYWNGQGGQPTWLWGGNDGTNMYVYNPANFSVSYANSAGYATNGGHLQVDYLGTYIGNGVDGSSITLPAEYDAVILQSTPTGRNNKSFLAKIWGMGMYDFGFEFNSMVNGTAYDMSSYYAYRAEGAYGAYAQRNGLTLSFWSSNHVYPERTPNVSGKQYWIYGINYLRGYRDELY